MSEAPFTIIHTKRSILHNNVLKYRKRPVKVYRIEDEGQHSPPDVPMTIVFPGGEEEEGGE